MQIHQPMHREGGCDLPDEVVDARIVVWKTVIGRQAIGFGEVVAEVLGVPLVAEPAAQQIAVEDLPPN